MKISSLCLILSIGLMIASCTSAKKTAARAAEKAEMEKREAMAKLTYTKDIKPVLFASCSPCHYPTEGKKKYIDTYAAVKENIADIIARCEKKPEEKGYMPFMSKKPALTPAQIQTLKDWVAVNMPE